MQSVSREPLRRISTLGETGFAQIALGCMLGRKMDQCDTCAFAQRHPLECIEVIAVTEMRTTRNFRILTR
jgi:hypothetical protein